EVYDKLRRVVRCYYDEDGSIGKRYAKADEIGVPFTITIDGQTLTDNTVTIRFRDTKQQVREHVEKLPEKILQLVNT
ncbi:MAG: His/Gly/Thr/Pro-type tRNA ligase C-terminal domain-containing protein, partial [Thermofilum sp.]